MNFGRQADSDFVAKYGAISATFAAAKHGLIAQD